MLKHLYLYIIIITAILLSLCSCAESNSRDALPGTTAPEDMDTTLVNTGRRAAAEALYYPKGSYERENRLLEIRAGEQRLRSAGMNASADAYIAGANEIISSEE